MRRFGQRHASSYAYNSVLITSRCGVQFSVQHGVYIYVNDQDEPRITQAYRFSTDYRTYTRHPFSGVDSLITENMTQPEVDDPYAYLSGQTDSVHSEGLVSFGTRVLLKMRLTDDESEESADARSHYRQAFVANDLANEIAPVNVLEYANKLDPEVVQHTINQMRTGIAAASVTVTKHGHVAVTKTRRT